MNPKVTIVTPSYNQAKYLEETILSVLNQDYPNIEYIIIDGGSSDGSVEIIKKFQNKLAYWVSEPDSGQSAAINKGFKRATGQIFNWLNSDDILMPSAVRIAVHYFMNNPHIGMVYGDRIVIDSKGNIVRLIQFPSFCKAWMMYNLRIPQESVFLRRQCWLDVQGLNERLNYCMDYDLWVRLSTLTNIYHIPFVLGAYRTHELAKSNKDSGNRQSRMRIEIADVMFRHFGKKRRAIMKKFYEKYEKFRLCLEKHSKSRDAEISSILRCISRQSTPTK